MTEQLDVLLSAALQRWWYGSRLALATRRVIATLQRPFDALGMEAYSKVSLKKYNPTAARYDVAYVRSGRR